jgi:23S rRNA pseudouridine2605 synthase
MTKADSTKDTENKGERIAKRMARAGLCSRRDAEQWIAQGRVRVNGIKLETPACVVTEQDEIEVDGAILGAAAKTRLFLYHKPTGLVTTNKDEKGRETVFDKMPEELGRVISIGRLDMNSEGLLLLTNDGGLARYLELPDTGWKRRYRVRVHGKVDEKKLAGLKNGITVGGIHYKSILANLDSTQGTNSWISVVLSEGKNREIRRVMEALGLKVNRLIRTAYGPFELGPLPKGAIQEVKSSVMKSQCAGYFGPRKNRGKKG